MGGRHNYYGDIARASVKRDMELYRMRKDKERVPNFEDLDKISKDQRVAYISDKSEYAKFAQYIVGKLVKVKERANIGSNSFYCEFVFDADRKALNAAAGWSDSKHLYLFDGIKFQK